MKIVIVSTFEHSGGAAVAANRLMLGLRKSGHEVVMLVRDKTSNDNYVYSIKDSRKHKILSFIRFTWERGIIFLYNKLSKKNLFAVSVANTGFDIAKHPLVKDADIVHLHWINQGFVSLQGIRNLLKTNKPIVWTMHDMWEFTGICHYSYTCERYMQECGECPFLESSKKNDLSHVNWKKKRFLNHSFFKYVAVSYWLQHRAQESSVLADSDVKVIPNVIDTNVFSPADKTKCRAELEWPVDKKIILMGAAQLNNSIKGFNYLYEAIQQIEKANNCMLVLFGAIKGEMPELELLPIPYIYMGVVKQETGLARMYQAADVTVVPSLYETFGQTLSEAMACGCPAVSFNNSGQTDIIDHQGNGYLAKYKDVEDLARGINWVLFQSDYESLSQSARAKIVNNFSERVVVAQYEELYRKML